MLSFLLGWAAGTIVTFNGPSVRRALARMIVNAEDAIASTSRHAMRITAQLSEDVEDIVAEARSQQGPVSGKRLV
jgi:ribosome-binding protein aMBF1 (putative translation factor)